MTDDRQVIKAAMADDWEPPSPHGPFRNPVDRFAHLSDWKREWLEGLSRDDLQEINEAIRFQRSARTIAKFGKWALLTVVGTFISAVALGEKAVVAWKWFSGGGR